MEEKRSSDLSCVRFFALLFLMGAFLHCSVPNKNTSSAGGFTCSFCHGTIDSPAPPWNTHGNTDTSLRSIGAHQSHVTESYLFGSVSCEGCHITPTDEMHSDGIIGIDFSGSSLTGAGDANWDGESCSDVYCHGSTLSGGSNRRPRWTTLDGSQAACGSCHGLPPADPHPAVLDGDCGACHPFDGQVPLDPSTHADGKVDFSGGGCGSCHSIPPTTPDHPVVPADDCGTCHPYDGTTPLDPATHNNGVLDIVCGSCHATPPATGAHLAHYGDVSSPTLVVYGDVRITQDFYPGGATTYNFGCGQCHPRDEGFHRDGTVQIELNDAAAPSGNIKLRNPVTAGYDGSACSDVYCHSSGQENPTFVTSPAWVGGDIPDGTCDACHDNPPRYASGGAGTATANTHLVMGDDGWELGHFGGLPGPWHSTYHGGDPWGWGADAAPITCQTCHYDSVDATNTGPTGNYYMDTTGDYDLGGNLGYDCSNCHTGAAGEAPTQSGKINPTKHLNGDRDVVFDMRTSLAGSTDYPYWFISLWGSGPNPVPPDSKVDGGVWSLHLSNSGYDQATKTCSNVPCHLKQSFGGPYDPLVWGVTPVGNATCNSCHQY